MLLIIVAFAFMKSNEAQSPMAEFVGHEKDGQEPGAVSLENLIFDGKRERAVFVAASGGGTRAAMYATSLMRGLHELGAIDDVVLASGVSGGGASLAYFAAHYKELSEGDDEAWRKYGDFATRPFIQDVLQGVVEWRIVGGVRMGRLLEESFRRGFGESRNSFRDIPGGFGLILNTALAGSLELSAAECAGGTFADCAQEHKDRSRSEVAGGRLIFTNLRLGSGFPNSEEIPGDGRRMDYVVVADPAVELSVAAALNANFPPVFSNAPVDDPTALKRYWVTDGGAVENRGILSLLFALREAVVEHERRVSADEPTEAPAAKPPALHIVVAEASAGSTKFSQDRGVGSKFGASSQIGSQLMTELFHDIKSRYKSLGGEVELHYLAMPKPLRIDSGLGTHWMLPEQVTIRGEKETREISGQAAKRVVYELHRGEGAGEPWYRVEDSFESTSKVVEEILEIVDEGDPEHRQTWRQLQSAL